MSWSRVSTLLRCPRQFDLRYRKKVPSGEIVKDHAAIEAGKLVHKILELAVTRCASFGYTFEGTGYSGIWRTLVGEYLSPDVRARMAALYVPSAEILRRIIALAGKFQAEVSTEKKLMLNRAWQYTASCPWERMAWLGYVDLEMVASGKVLIVDYKSEHFSEDRSEKVAVQTAMYAYAEFLRSKTIRQIQTGCAYLLDSRIEMDNVIFRDDIQIIENTLYSFYKKYLSRLESGTTEPEASLYCQWCGYTQGCPVFKERINGTEKEKD